MQNRLYQFMLFLTLMALILTSAISTTIVHADDGGSGGEPTEPAGGEGQPADETTPTPTVAEILDQIPQDTDLVVVSQDGVEPLATQQAAQILVEGDPMWCPSGQTPGDAGCTAGYSTVTDLISNLGTKSGSGAIYFTSTYTGNDATFDHTNVNLGGLTDVTLEGGWNGLLTGSGYGLSGVTTFSAAPLAIINWGGSVTINNIAVDSVSSDSGLYVQTNGDITLTNASASNNGFDGADLINYAGTGNVTVNGGDFSGNDDAGLYIASQGSVAVNNASVDANRDGIIIDNSYGTGAAGISASSASGNTWTGVYVKSAGDITLNNVIASGNSVAGAYLDALSGSGDILITNNSTFNSNGDWGLKAFADDGSITATNVFEDGGGLTENGAWLKSFNADVTVNGGTFNGNLQSGLLAVAGGQVNLTNVSMSNNGGDGARVYSLYNFACFGNKDIPVNVNGGTFANNGGYGIYTQPGAAGSLNLSGSPAFTGNVLGDAFVDPLVNPCPPPDPNKAEHHKPSNLVEIPEAGGEPVLQDCENFSSTTLRLHSGTSVKVKCPFTGTSQLTDLTRDELPGQLPASLTFASAIDIDLEHEGSPLPVMTEGGLLTISFVIPEELLNKRLSILYWDPTANDGQGDWIELPLDQFGGESFPLYPDDPQDGRRICSGFERSGNTVSVTLNFPGVFALVAR